MDIFIKMCDCPEIQVPHWQKGWQEGDYFWDGEKVCLCGMDYLVVKDLFVDGRNRVRFAMREPMTVLVYDQDSPCGLISAKIGTYEIKTLGNGLWLPTQSQLQKMVEQSDNSYSRKNPVGKVEEFASFVYDEFFRPTQISPQPSMEQLWLAFYMHVKFNKTWDGDKWVNK